MTNSDLEFDEITNGSRSLEVSKNRKIQESGGEPEKNHCLIVAIVEVDVLLASTNCDMRVYYLI